VEVVTRRWSIRPRPDAYGGLSVTEFARRLGVSRMALSRVVNGRAAVSAELAKICRVSNVMRPYLEAAG